MVTCHGRIANLELPQQVLPLKEQLPPTHLNRRCLVGAADLRRVEFVAPPIRFHSDGAKIGSDERERLGMIAEALELGMLAIAACTARQNLLRQERFPPQGDEPDSVQVLRVQAPESHQMATILA